MLTSAPQVRDEAFGSGGQILKGEKCAESGGIPPLVSDCNGDRGEMKGECHLVFDWEEETKTSMFPIDGESMRLSKPVPSRRRRTMFFVYVWLRGIGLAR
jgi:hypothetical protein